MSINTADFTRLLVFYTDPSNPDATLTQGAPEDAVIYLDLTTQIQPPTEHPFTQVTETENVTVRLPNYYFIRVIRKIIKRFRKPLPIHLLLSCPYSNFLPLLNETIFTAFKAVAIQHSHLSNYNVIAITLEKLTAPVEYKNENHYTANKPSTYTQAINSIFFKPSAADENKKLCTAPPLNNIKKQSYTDIINKLQLPHFKAKKVDNNNQKPIYQTLSFKKLLQPDAPIAINDNGSAILNHIEQLKKQMRYPDYTSYILLQRKLQPSTPTTPMEPKLQYPDYTNYLLQQAKLKPAAATEQQEKTNPEKLNYPDYTNYVKQATAQQPNSDVANAKTDALTESDLQYPDFSLHFRYH